MYLPILCKIDIDHNLFIMKRSIGVNYTSYYTETEKHTIQDLNTSNFTIRDQGIGDDILKTATEAVNSKEQIYT